MNTKEQFPVKLDRHPDAILFNDDTALEFIDQ